MSARSSPGRRFRSGTRLAVAAVSLVLTGSSAAMADPAQAGTNDATTIDVDVADSLGYVNPNVFGVIFNWFYDAAETYNPDNQKWRTEFVKLVEQAGLTSIRFFGGSLSGTTTQWQDGIGPILDRSPAPTTPGMSGLVMTAGPDEFGQFVGRIGGDGNPIVNVDQSATSAADYVAYMTTPVPRHPSSNPDDPSYWAALRAKNGHPQPYDMPVWDVGNEVSFMGDTGSGWTTGSTVSIGTHTTACPAGGEHDCLYAFGGTAHFDGQPVVGRSDLSPAADVSSGAAGQSFYVDYAPVQPGTQTVYVNGTAWTRTPDFSHATSTDQVYTLDDKIGEISFGDGRHGAIPPTGSKITVSYDSGPHDGFIDYYGKMKAVNPSIKVCAEDIQPNFLAAMGSTYRYDCVGDHTGLSAGFPSTSLTDADFVQQLMSAPNAQYAALVADQRLVDSHAGRHVPIVPSAYGHSQGNYPADDPQEHQQVADGILQARQLQNFISLGVPQADRFMMAAELFAPGGGPSDYNSAGANINGLFESDGNGHFAVMPTGLAMGLLSQLGGRTRIGAAVRNGPLVTLPDGSSIPALSITATKDNDGTVTVAVVNSSMTDAVQAQIDLGSVTLRGEATVRTLSGSSPFATNTPTDPNQVTIGDASRNVSGHALSHLFPAHSVTVVTIRTTNPTA